MIASRKANYIYHMLSVARCGYDNDYGAKYRGDYPQEDLALLKKHERLMTCAGGIHQKLAFRYTTIEHVEPILSFSYDHDQLWKISSPWMKNAADVIVEEHVLASQVNKLMRCFQKYP